MSELGFSGHIRIIEVDSTGNERVVFDGPNTITNAGKTLVCGQIAGEAVSPHILYMAWGDNDPSLALAATNTALGSEAHRLAISNHTPNGVGSFVTRCYLSPSDGLENSGNIQELGWFAASATHADPSTAGQGTMIARVLWSYTKTNTTSVIIERTDTIA